MDNDNFEILVLELYNKKINLYKDFFPDSSPLPIKNNKKIKVNSLIKVNHKIYELTDEQIKFLEEELIRIENTIKYSLTATSSININLKLSKLSNKQLKFLINEMENEQINILKDKLITKTKCSTDYLSPSYLLVSKDSKIYKLNNKQIKILEDNLDVIDNYVVKSSLPSSNSINVNFKVNKLTNEQLKLLVKEIEAEYIKIQEEKELKRRNAQSDKSLLTLSGLINGYRKFYKKYDLNKEQINILVYEMNKGNTRARELLILSNLSIANYLAYLFSSKGHNWDDIFQYAMLGCVKSIDKYDPNRGTKLSTYCYQCMLRHVRSSILKNEKNIAIPNTKLKIIWNIKATISNFERDEGRKPGEEELSHRLNLPLDLIKSYLDLIDIDTFNNTILSSGAKNDDYNELDEIDNIPDINTNPEFSFIQKCNKETLYKAIDNLPTKEREFIILRFGLKGNLPHSKGEICTVLNIEKEDFECIQIDILFELKNLLQNFHEEDMA